MSAATLNADLDKMLKAEIHTVPDPGNGATIAFSDKGVALCECDVAGIQIRVLESAAYYGLGTELTVVARSMGTSLLILGSDDGTFTLSNIREYLTFRVMRSTLAGVDTKVWKLVGSFAGAAAGRGVTYAGAQVAKIDTITLTAAEILNTYIRGVPTAAAAYTLPTAALLVAAIPGCRTGDQFSFTISNKSAGANTITATAGTGVTVEGTATVAQNTARVFKCIVTNATLSSEAYTIAGC